MKWIEDNFLYLYCLALFTLAGTFLGHEIVKAKYENELIAASRIVRNCNELITRNK